MNSKKKKILIITLVLVLLIGIVGITYAAFSYTQTGLNQELVTGDIYMHYKESNTLTLENALPSNTYDPNNYFEFQIVGKNTNTKYDIYYDIREKELAYFEMMFQTLTKEKLNCPVYLQMYDNFSTDMEVVDGSL